MATAFDPRLTSYFGDNVLQAGFMPVPHLLLRHAADLGLTPQQVVFLLHIMATTWDLGSPALTINQLAGRMGVSRRTVQHISAELHATGLVEIVDQFDESGARIENAYDLSGLFEHLAVFAPAPVPPGVRRQALARAHREQPAVSPVQTQGSALEASLTPGIPVQTTTPPPVQPIAPPPMQPIAPPPCSPLHLPCADSNTSPMQPAAWALTESKNHGKNQLRQAEEQQQPRAAVAAGQVSWFGQEESMPSGGRSLRWDKPLTPAEVKQTRQMLSRIGLNADVADAVAPTLHPAEGWGLWLHARTAGLGLAWIAAQLFNAKSRTPRMAGIPGASEAAGRLLASLPAEAACALLDIMLQTRDREQAALMLVADARTTGVDIEAALAAVWTALQDGEGGTRRAGIADTRTR